MLEDRTNSAQELVPSLQEEYEQIMRELEQEKALVAEIEACDQQYLSELKTTLAEQGCVIFPLLSQGLTLAILALS